MPARFPKWLPLVGGMAAFVLGIGALLIWLIFGGRTGKQRGLVIINLRQTQTVHVTDAGGAASFDERVEYSALVDAQFRIAIGADRIVFAAKPPE